MTIHDYFLSRANFNLKKNIESLQLELAKEKKKISNESKIKKISEFYPSKNDLNKLPKRSTLIRISFTLKKPYTSKDEGEYHIINNKISYNPIVRDKFTKSPMIRPTTWKGNLRHVSKLILTMQQNNETKEKIIERLFGSDPEKKEQQLKGKLYFFPTLFKSDTNREIITPLSRYSRIPKRGSIDIEVMKKGKKGTFHILYLAYQDSKDSKEETKKELLFLVEALKLMFYTYGFSAKKSSGFGVIEKQIDEGKLWINAVSDIKEKEFSNIFELKQKVEELWREEID